VPQGPLGQWAFPDQVPVSGLLHYGLGAPTKVASEAAFCGNNGQRLLSRSLGSSNILEVIRSLLCGRRVLTCAGRCPNVAGLRRSRRNFAIL